MTQKTKRPQLESGVTPKGTAVWPRLSGKPDTKFNKMGAYSTQVAFSPDSNPQDAEFLEGLQQRYDKAVADAEASVKDQTVLNKKTGKKEKVVVEPLDPPWQPEYEGKEGGKPTGRVLVRFKMTASGKRDDGTEWHQKPALADAKNHAVTADLPIGNGSVIKVAFQYNPFLTAKNEAGLALRLVGVQVLSLVEFVGKTPESMGFSEEEGGYEFSETAEDAATEDADAPAKTSGEQF